MKTFNQSAKRLVLFLAALCIQQLSYAQWQNNGPEGGMVFDVAQKGNTLLCLTQGGVYFSSDSGQTWAPSRSGIPFVNAYYIYANANKFIVTAENGSYTSSDGQNWTFVSNNAGKILYTRGPYMFGVGSTQSSTRVILSSSDDGATWQTTNVGFDIDASQGTGMAAVDTTLFIGTTTGMAYSVNNGQSWVHMNITSGGNNIGAIIDIKPCNGGLLLLTKNGVYTHSGNIYSTGALNVFTVPSNLAAHFISVLNNKYQVILNDKSLTAPYNGMIQSSDGTNWSVDSSFYGYAKAFGVRNLAAGTFICTSHGMKVSTDNGVTWTTRSSGIKAHNVRDVFANNGKIYASVTYNIFNMGYNYYYGGGAFVSSDDGVTWQQFNLPDSIGVTKLFADGNKLIAFCAYGDNSSWANKMFRSVDSGTTWTEVTGVTNLVYNDNLFYVNGKLYLTSPTSFDVSSDMGATWQSMAVSGFPLTANIALDAVGSNLFATDFLYLNYNGGVFKTTDNGATWVQSNNGINNNMPVTKVRGIGNSLFAIQQFGGMGIGTALSRSGDLASSWTDVSSTLPVHFFDDIIGWSGNLYLSTGYIDVAMNGIDSGFVYHSTDNGTTWTNMSAGGLPCVSFTNMTVNNSKLYVGTKAYSLWSTTVTPGTGTGLNTLASSSINVSVYPNPANAELNISCKETVKSIEIMDVSGKQLIVTPNTKVDVSNLKTGIYLVKVNTESGSAVQKFVKQ